MIIRVYLSRRRKLARLVLLKVLIKSKGQCSESTRIPPEPLRCYCGTTSRRLLWSVIAFTGFPLHFMLGSSHTDDIRVALFAELDLE
ncbi:hypothetical protein NC652_026441 [Populus alba x Populus x berolinensis]|nr:hypothetical protein NC652_026441 [Populus alba x Populus x berolinensis]